MIPPTAGQPGGELSLEYVNAVMGERHTLRVHVAHFDPTAVGPANDRHYDGTGITVPDEFSVLATYIALAALWQPYYTADWSLYARNLYYNDGGTRMTYLDPPPDFTVFTGTASPLAVPVMDRVFRLLGRTGCTRQFWLSQVPGTELIYSPFEVGSASGGLDVRDQNLIAYLSGAIGGGVVQADNGYCIDPADMRILWARALEAVPGGGTGTGIVDDCLTFPHLAALCNPSTDLVTLVTPTGEFDWDATGITLPGGHRLETV